MIQTPQSDKNTKEQVMARHLLPKAGLLALAGLLLVGCDEGFSAGDAGFRAQYLVARDALEAGRYDQAGRAYARLLPKAGPLAARIRLEYAHALLRGGDFAEAARAARQVTALETGTARNAALAVQATAEHELGLDAIQRGETERGRRFLQAADAAIAVVLAEDPALDPLGALAGRQASIRVRLKALG